MNVLCMTGAFCGDCVRQCPIMLRIAEASSVIDLRFLDRDTNPDLSERLKILGGSRIPVVVFLRACLKSPIKNHQVEYEVQDV
jgi:epoxyqueuosine reductase QueG